MTFTRRAITLQFALGQGAFATGSDTVTLDGLRVSASISRPGGIAMTELNLRAYGIPLDVMNRLTILGKPLQGSKSNTVQVLADGSVCFAGTIAQAWVDANSAPDVSLIVVANTGGLDKLKPVSPSSYKGAASAVDIITDMANRLSTPLPVQNNGVNATLTNTYYSGALYDQMHDVARAGNFDLVFDDSAIAIWPHDSYRDDPGTIISADTGMVGYPIVTDTGLTFETLFNPAIRYGDLVSVKTILRGSGKWRVFKINHELESETPNGRWFSTVDCLLFDSPDQQRFLDENQ